MIKTLTVGTATRDVFLASQLFKIVHDPAHLKKLGFPTGEAQCFALGGKIEVDKPIMTLGGGGANSAVTFARQGFKTEALLKLGDDKNGRDILTHLKDEKVKPVFFIDKKLGTDYSSILLSPSGERTVLNYRGASEKLTLSEVKKKNYKCDAAYIAPGKISFDVVSYLVKTLKKQEAVVAMNPSKHYLDLGAKKLKPIFDNLDVVLMNREEGAYLTGVKYEDERDILKKFDMLVPGLAVLTDGPKGVVVSDGRRIYRAGIYKEKKIADRTGAGDSFGSGFTAGLLCRVSSIKYQVSRGRKNPIFREEDIIYGIRMGSANATSVVEEIGAQTGILTKSQFEKQSRWKNLKITLANI